MHGTCLRSTRNAGFALDISHRVRHSDIMAKPALGRGLGALLGASTAVEASSAPVPRTEQGVQRVPLSRLAPSPLQPRRDFTPESLEELAASIQKQGILQPLIVRGTPD